MRSRRSSYRDRVSVFLSGLGAGLALIIAIGAQNAYVLRQGIRRQHVGVVVGICLAADALLIALGTLGIGVIVERASWLLTTLRWAGVVYLVWFALRSFHAAWRPGSLTADDGGGSGSSWRAVAVMTLSLTFLNPHVYLDTVVMLGNLANQHGDARWVFAGGAVTGSFVWFPALGLGARALAKSLARPAVWRGIDIGVGIVMLVIAFSLAVGH